VLYPEGGGQPTDTGMVGKAKCSFVTKTAAGHVFHRLDQPVQPSSEVLVKVDWERRYDLMQQHSASHLVQYILEDMHQARYVSWRLTADTTERVTMTVAHAGLTKAELRAVDRRMNELIRARRACITRILHTKDEVDAYMQRTGCKNIPYPSKKKGPTRVVEIEGLEQWTQGCGGTHVTNLSELQLVKVLGGSVTKFGYRVDFVSGDRAIELLARRCDERAQVAAALGCSEAQVVPKAAKAHKENRELAASLAKMEAALHEVHTDRLVEAARGERALWHHFDGPMSGQWMAQLVDLFVQRREKQGDGDEGRALLLTSSLGQFVLYAPAVVLKAHGRAVVKAFGGRGGGRGKMHGRLAEGVGRVPEAMAILTAAMEKETKG